MYNIRIKQLPKNGDQRNYSLVDRNDLYIKVNPINQDSNVKNTISAVPREEANIEAEGGETVIGDINNDGFLEHSKIVGKRHTEGGVPLNVAPGSFIFSDTKKLKIKDPEVLSIFGITKFDKGGVTPAKIAQKYPVNNYMNILKDESTDPVSKRTATQMIKNNLEKLGMLALVQESMKGFPDGVPAIAQSVMAGLQGQQSPGQEQGEGVAHEVMEGREAAGEEQGEMRYGGGYYQNAGTTKEKQKAKPKATTPAPGTFYINGKPNLITKKYKGFFGDEWVQFKNPITVVDEDGNPDTMEEMTVEDWNKLTKNKTLKMGYEDNFIAPNHYTDIANLTWWNQDRSLSDIGRGVKYNTLTYSTTPGVPAKPKVKKEMQPGYTFKEGNKTYKVVASDVYSPYGSEAGNRQAVSVEQIDDPDQNFGSFFDTKFGKKLIPIDEYNKIVGLQSGVPQNNVYVPPAASTNTNPYADQNQEVNAQPLDTTIVETDRSQKVVVKEDNSNPAPKAVITPQTKTGNTQSAPRTKKVPAKVETSRFVVPSGKYQGQEAFAVKRGDTIRINYPDGAHDTYINGKLIPGYKHGGDLPKHQGTTGSSTVGDASSSSMMDDGSSNGFFGGIGDFFSDLFGGDDKSKSNSATSSLDQEAIAAVANPAPVSSVTTANNSVLADEVAKLFQPAATPIASSQPAVAPTAQGLQNGSVTAISTGDPNKQVIANNTQNFEIEPSSVNFLPFTPKDKNTYEPWKSQNYDTQWKPMAEQAMSNVESAKAIDDYLTNIAAKGKYGPNILNKLQGLTGQARYDKILELATDGRPGPFHNAFLEAMTAKKPQETPTQTVQKKTAWSCRQDPATGVKEIYEFEYEGEMPSGSYNSRAEAEAGCNAKQPAPEKPRRRKPWWIQDTVNYAGAMTDMIDKYGPAMSQVDFETPGYVLADPDRQIAAIQEQAAREQEAAMNTTAGNVAGASLAGQSDRRLGQIANVIGAVENQNVGTVNQALGRNAQINNQERLTNEQFKQKYIAESALANQNYDNARRALKWRQLQAFNNGVTNFQRTNQLESMFPQYEFDRISGNVYFTDGRQSYDEFGRPLFDPYVNPTNPTGRGSRSDSGYLSAAELAALKKEYIDAGFSDKEAVELIKEQAGRSSSNWRTPQNMLANAVLTGNTMPSQRKYGGYMKQYGGTVFNFGALPLYFFED